MAGQIPDRPLPVAGLGIKQRTPYLSPREFTERRLLEGIARGDLRPGVNIKIRELADYVGGNIGGNSPIRETIASLGSHGQKVLITVEDYRLRIADVPVDDIETLYGVRAHAEGLATRDAALSMTPTLFAALERLQQTMHEAVTQGNYYQYIAANEEWHTQLLDLTSRRRIVRATIEQAVRQSLVLWQDYVTTQISQDGLRAALSLEEHDAIMLALKHAVASTHPKEKERWAAVAGEAMRTHIESEGQTVAAYRRDQA